MKRLVFSFISFGAIIIALIISFFGTITVIPDVTESIDIFRTTWVIHNVVWGPAHIEGGSTWDGTSTFTYQMPMDAINLYSTFLIIALVIGVLCVAFSLKDQLRPLYFVFSVILIIAAIAFFGADSTIASYINNVFKITKDTLVKTEGHIACGVFLLISGILTAVAGIVSNEDYYF